MIIEIPFTSMRYPSAGDILSLLSSLFAVILQVPIVVLLGKVLDHFQLSQSIHIWTGNNISALLFSQITRGRAVLWGHFLIKDMSDFVLEVLTNSIQNFGNSEQGRQIFNYRCSDPRLHQKQLTCVVDYWSIRRQQGSYLWNPVHTVSLTNSVIQVRNFQMDVIFPHFLISHHKVMCFNKCHVDVFV